MRYIFGKWRFVVALVSAIGVGASIFVLVAHTKEEEAARSPGWPPTVSLAEWADVPTVSVADVEEIEVTTTTVASTTTTAPPETTTTVAPTTTVPPPTTAPVTVPPTTAPPPPPVTTPPTTAPPPPVTGGCDGSVWGPAFAVSGFSPAYLRVASCEIVPYGTLVAEGHGKVCAKFNVGTRQLFVDERTLDHKCAGGVDPMLVLIHEIGHSWHTVTQELSDWSFSGNVEQIAECFAAIKYGGAPCSAELRQQVLDRL